MTVPTVLMNEKHSNTDLWFALYVGQDRPETQYATKEAARFVSRPTRAEKCMLKRLCKYYSETPVFSWSFPYHQMPSEIKAMTDVNWAGDLEGLRSRLCGWIYFGDHLLETYCQRSRLWRCQWSFRRSIVVAAAVVRKRCGSSSILIWRAQRSRFGNKNGRFEAKDSV